MPYLVHYVRYTDRSRVLDDAFDGRGGEQPLSVLEAGSTELVHVDGLAAIAELEHEVGQLSTQPTSDRVEYGESAGGSGGGVEEEYEALSGRVLDGDEGG